MDIIARRNLIETVDIMKQLQELSHLRLDREKLKIFDLDLPRNITHLYLQYNLLTSITITSGCLKFLSLGNNSLLQIELNTENLQVLQLENNSISDFKSLPKDIQYLNLRGNPCSLLKGYRLEILKYFSNLKELDDVSLIDSEEDYEEEDVNVDYSKSFQGILQRSKQRQLEFNIKY